MRSLVAGISTWSIPSGASASTTAFITAWGAAMSPPGRTLDAQGVAAVRDPVQVHLEVRQQRRCRQRIVHQRIR